MSNTVKLIILCFIFILAGCHKFQSENNVNLFLQTDSKLNPDLRGRPSPVVVIFYQLTSQDKFNNADFFSLYENPQKVLGEDLISYQQTELRPDLQVKSYWAITDKTRYIGIIAAFRDLSGKQWRTIMPVNKNTQLKASLIENQISLKKSE